MASILGFKLKGRTIYKGEDGQANQGNLWYGNKKIAWFNDSADGRPIDLDYYSREIEKEYQPILQAAITEYFKRYPIGNEYGDIIPDEEMFMSELIELMDREGHYKKAVKKGWPVVIIYRKSENSPYLQIVGLKTEADAQKYIEKYIKSNDITKYSLYKSIDDFDIK